MESRLRERSHSKAFGGSVTFFEHDSDATKTAMRFAIFRPPLEVRKTLFFLSGLTCTDENFITKACALEEAARLGIALVCPDTSPRGTDLPGEHDNWDFGSGAGFYLNAVREPWAQHYQMETYISKELPELVGELLGLHGPYGIFGHSMGGHGALVLGLKHQNLFDRISAFAPIVCPSEVPWGQKAFEGYLGDDRKLWGANDACAVLESLGGYDKTILVDQGTEDQALETQLRPELFLNVCQRTNTEMHLRFHEGYDHGYFFVASFVKDHLQFHVADVI